MRDLFRDYLNFHPHLTPYFAHNPRAIRDIDPQPRPWAPAVREALRVYQDRIGGTATFTGNEHVVATGQQPGLFTGPLYTIYKAITALRLAQDLESTSGKPCVPLFWIGSDDHDFEEAASAHFLTKTHKQLTLAYTPDQQVNDRALFRVALEPQLHDLIHEVAAACPGSENRDEVAAFLHDSLDHSSSVADWFACIMARLFRDTPLLFFPAHLQAAREAVIPIIEREIRDPLATTRAVNESGQELAALGYPQQIEKNDNECSFFLEMGERRRKVLFEGSRFILPEENIACSTDEMLAFLKATPERFSPNVALRCVIQQHLFPVTAYVAGPGEIAYWAQFKTLFAFHETDMPAVYPRKRCVLTSTKLRKLMTKLGLSMDDLADVHERVLEKALASTESSPARDALQTQRPAIEAALTQLTEALLPHEKTAHDMASSLSEHVRGNLDRIESTILKGDKNRLDAVARQVDRLQTALCPWRKPQERVYTVFSFLFEHGWDLIPRLTKELDIEDFGLQEVEL